MKIESTTTFNFSFVADGISYNFGINAPTQDEAAKKLQRALELIVEELKSQPSEPDLQTPKVAIRRPS